IGKDFCNGYRRNIPAYKVLVYRQDDLLQDEKPFLPESVDILPCPDITCGIPGLFFRKFSILIPCLKFPVGKIPEYEAVKAKRFRFSGRIFDKRFICNKYIRHFQLPAL